MKILGGWIIAYGIIALAFGVGGLQIRLLWFLDAPGPGWAYVLKLAFIALGIWVWRRDRSPAVEEETTEEEQRRAWAPVGIALALIFGIIAFVTVSVVKDTRLEHRLEQMPPVASWASSPVNVWPTFVLMQKAQFVHHTAMEAGCCACLVRLPTGEIVALTAARFLGADGGVNPGFIRSRFGGLDEKKLATLDGEISSWSLFLPGDAGDTSNEGIKVAGLYGKSWQWREPCGEVLLRLAQGNGNYPATPLDLRLAPVSLTERLRIIACARTRNGEVVQRIYEAHRVPGLAFICELETPSESHGFDGALVLDKDGLLAGIISGEVAGLNNSAQPTQVLSGHLASELLPVLKPAVVNQGAVVLTPLKPVFKLPVASGSGQGSELAKETI